MSRPETQLEGGSYEVIRGRLVGQAAELGRLADALNARRKQTFGGTELTVVGSERVRTENNCVPRDIVAVGKHLLFGFNVFLGLKSETHVGDVLSLHRFEKTPEGFDLSEVPATEGGGFLADARFVKDFQELYRFYKGTKLKSLARTETRLFVVFQVGASVRDVRVFRFSLDAGGSATYVDNRGEREYVYPPQHDFEWTVAGRDRFVRGKHPHVNVLDTVFVETVGGDLTVKVEDNTESGKGVYSEPVEDPDQSLDDGEFRYAKVGALILLEVKPFREEKKRYLVFNTRTEQVTRIDAIGQACVQLPEDQGIVFPGGYYLQTGDHKLFAADTADLELKRVIRSPNGEDVLYVFHHRADGRYLLLPYNLVRKEIQTQVDCHGYSVFGDGRMLVFRSTTDEPTRVHGMQVWQTPFVSAEHAAAAPADGSYLAKIGNADLVRGVSDAYTVRRLAESATPTRKTYEDLIAAATRVQDAYPWLGHPEVGLKGAVEEVRRTAELVVDEFEKVRQLERRAADALAEATASQTALTGNLRPEEFRAVEPFLAALTSLRRQRGHLVSLREVRYVDLAAIDALEQDAVGAFDRVSAAAVEFLQKDEALAPLSAKLDELLEKVAKVERTTEAKPLGDELDGTHAGLELLGEVVGGLSVGDPVVRAKILEGIGDVFGKLNRVRATLAARRKELAGREGRAEFAAQFRLFGQSIDSALAVADTPERCDEQLSKLQVTLEELEGRFGELDEFVAELEKKREELLSAFDARKQALLDERQRRAQNLFGAAERIFSGMARRVKSFAGEDELNAYFAADAMVAKARQLAEQLLALQDSVKADEVLSRLKTAQQDALRQLRDKKDLYEDGQSVIKLGAHRFLVNTQPLELTVLPKDGALRLHLTGTDFSEPVEDPAFADTRTYWEQHLVSETAEVYRGEHLAASILFDAEEGGTATGVSLAKLQEAALDEAELLSLVKRIAGDRYDEGYERGVHDADAAAILGKLLHLRATAGLLRFAPTPRALACLFWAFHPDAAAKELDLRKAFEHSPAVAALAEELAGRIGAFCAGARVPCGEPEARLAGRYLAEELLDGGRFVTSAGAKALADGLYEELERRGTRRDLEDDLRSLEKHVPERFALARAWLDAYADDHAPESRHLVAEAAVLLLTERRLDREVSSALTDLEVTGLLGAHPRIRDGKLSLRLDEYVARLGEHLATRVPGFRAYKERLKALLERERRRLRLEELVPKVLSSFVRNRLIAEVYLPLIGKNLAKQLGAAGETKRTDRMGMLLLLSPPGYGKTTLMEYVASRLGLVFVKVNGPALGHEVRSIDPSEAPDATSRQEVEKINLAFEMGNNVMLYLDDIQHTSAELLQKFISLCDGQRRIEGVWRGQSRTYDLRGKKFCVVMAGNPYTESGERFRIPDMLANRADTYNLGEVLEGKGDVFALSYVENALGSNAALAPLTTKDPKDVHALIRMARGEEVPSSELSGAYAAVELGEMVEVLKRLLKVQATLGKVNAQYIASAAQDDRFRTEPPFKLQGSYRNMAKLAEKVVAAMTDDEVEALLDDHYAAESQTLTQGAEHNLLKLAELRGRLTPPQAKRWEEIKRGYERVQLAGGREDDPVARVTGTLSSLGDRLRSIQEAVAAAASSAARPAAAAPAPVVQVAAPAVELGPLLPKLDELRVAIEAVAKASPAKAPKAAPAAAPAPEALGPYLARLDEVLRQLATNRAVAVPAAAAPAAATPGSVRAPADVEKQLVLIEHALLPLGRAAQRNLQAGGGSMQAIRVWQRVSEALELLRMLLPPDHDPVAAARDLREPDGE